MIYLIVKLIFIIFNNLEFKILYIYIEIYD